MLILTVFLCWLRYSEAVTGRAHSGTCSQGVMSMPMEYEPLDLIDCLECVGQCITQRGLVPNSDTTNIALGEPSALQDYCRDYCFQEDYLSCAPSSGFFTGSPQPAVSEMTPVIRSIFGGMFTTTDHKEHSKRVVTQRNLWFNVDQCPAGYNRYTVGRVMYKKLVAMLIFVCLSALKDPLDNFGGVYSEVRETKLFPPGIKSDTFVNPMTDKVSCPEGYAKVLIGRSFSWYEKDNQRGVSHFLCIKFKNGSSIVGGGYMLTTGSVDKKLGKKYGNLINEGITNMPSCSDDYLAIKMFDMIPYDAYKTAVKKIPNYAWIGSVADIRGTVFICMKKSLFADFFGPSD